MPPQQQQQRDGPPPPPTIREWQLSPLVAMLGNLAFVMTTMLGCYVLLPATWGQIEPSRPRSTCNARRVVLTSPREVALSRSGEAATLALTKDRLSSLPWWAPSDRHEKTAVEAISSFGKERLSDTLFFSRDSKTHERMSVTAAFAERMADDTSCPLETDVADTAGTHDPSTTCKTQYGACYDSCEGGFFVRPIAGACHLVCLAVQNHCDMCATKKVSTSRRVRKKVHSWISGKLPSDDDKIDDAPKPGQHEEAVGEVDKATRFTSRVTTTTVTWACSIASAIWLVQTMAFVLWIYGVDGRLSEIERRIHDVLRAQEEQAAALTAANDEDDGNVAQPANGRGLQDEGDGNVAQPANGRGLLAIGSSFLAGWTWDRARDLGIVA